MLDDGLIFLTVDSVRGKDIKTTVVFGGVLKDNKGMNLPDTPIPISCLTTKDKKDIQFGLKNDVDFIALSFVQSANDIRAARRLASREKNPPAFIAKIERALAVEKIEEIIEECDGVMIARGDLGVECPLEQVPGLQKQIIKAANRAGKFVITATQMLESMTEKARPTRAEVSDVANAVFDGTDAVMLSAETASGNFPVKSVKTMSRIIIRAEEIKDHIYPARKRQGFDPIKTVPTAITSACAQAERSLKTAAIVAFTHSGRTASDISQMKPSSSIIALSPFERTCRRLSVVGGVIPKVVRMMKHTDEMLSLSKPAIKSLKLWKPKSHVLMLSGTPVAQPGSTNLLKIHEMN